MNEPHPASQEPSAPNSTVFVSVDPSTGRELARYPAMDAEAVELALQRAVADQARWKKTPVAARAALLSELARLLELEAKDHAALMSREMGKPFREAVAEIKKCALTARHFAEHGPTMLGVEPVQTDAHRSEVRHDPLGVILAIMPWNFPFWQVFRFGLPALLAGNAILLKHAPATMGSAAAIESLVRRAGAPRGLLQNLPLEVDEVGRLIADPRVAAVTLTGSTLSGRAVAAQAGAALKPCVLELGGSDAFIVMPSVDLEYVVKEAVRARVQNNGQSCIAAKRFFVHAAVYDVFVSRFVEQLAALKVGDPMDESVDLGPLASRAARERLQAQVERAVEAGGRILIGGRPQSGPGFFYPPTVLEGVPVEAAVAREELFGPVAMVWKVENVDEALRLANDSPYGLSASVWTRDEDEATRAVTELEVGSVFVNGMPRSDPRLPFGGLKESGFGRELGRAGLLAFTATRAIWRRSE